MFLSLGLDLGTTCIKAAFLNEEGLLEGFNSVEAPPLQGEGLLRQSDPLDMLLRVTDLLGEMWDQAPRPLPLGISSQRSSFVLWDKRTKEPLTPLISWQDRRALSWCERNQDFAPFVQLQMGLPLSPHYAGPKLAFLLEENDSLCHRVLEGECLFGTLESFLLWNLSEGRVHQTDLTMAARTLLADPVMGDWSGPVLVSSAIDQRVLPEIVTSTGQEVELFKGVFQQASVSDQAACTLSILGTEEGSVLVNLGTGCFVLCPTGKEFVNMQGYLSGPLLYTFEGDCYYALEGTIHSGGQVVDRFGLSPTLLPIEDPTPAAFCLPETSGSGSPHWDTEAQLLFSPVAENLVQKEKRRIVLEGILFRVREILEDLLGQEFSFPIVLSGGLSQDPFVAQALSSCLQTQVFVVSEHQGSLLGAARLAASLEPKADLDFKMVAPSNEGAYLHEKYHRFKAWRKEALALSKLV